MKLNIKNVDVQLLNKKSSNVSQQLLQAGCCCGGSSEVRPVWKRQEQTFVSPSRY